MGPELATPEAPRKPAPNTPRRAFWLVSSVYQASVCFQVAISCLLLYFVDRKLKNQMIDGVFAHCLATVDVNSALPCNTLIVASGSTLACYAALFFCAQAWRGGEEMHGMRAQVYNLLYRPYLALAGGVVWGLLALYTSASGWGLQLPEPFAAAEPWRAVVGVAVWVQVALWALVRGTDKLLDGMVPAEEGVELKTLDVVYVD